MILDCRLKKKRRRDERFPLRLFLAAEVSTRARPQGPALPRAGAGEDEQRLGGIQGRLQSGDQPECFAEGAMKITFPYGKAWASWFMSEQGKRMASGETYGQYLENRLHCAFAAGWNAREKAKKVKRSFRQSDKNA
jgi:hypothetical protein